MRNKKRFADRPIGYDNSAPTAWVTITLLVIFVALFTQTALASAYLADVHYSSDYNDAIFEAAYEKRERQAYLVELRNCESSNKDFAAGDGGDSNGPYMWQKASLEEVVGYPMSYGEYYALATDYERIHPITYKAYFEMNQAWRWQICTKKINAQRLWKL